VRISAIPAAALALCCALLLALFVGSSPASAEVTGLETKSYTATAAADEIKTLAVACSSGKKVLGGGFEAQFSPALTQQVLASVPQGATGGENGGDNANAWVAEVHNTDTVPHGVTVWVICATVGS